MLTLLLTQQSCSRERGKSTGVELQVLLLLLLPGLANKSPPPPPQTGPQIFDPCSGGGGDLYASSIICKQRGRGWLVPLQCWGSANTVSSRKKRGEKWDFSVDRHM